MPAKRAVTEYSQSTIAVEAEEVVHVVCHVVSRRHDAVPVGLVDRIPSRGGGGCVHCIIILYISSSINLRRIIIRRRPSWRACPHRRGRRHRSSSRSSRRRRRSTMTTTLGAAAAPLRCGDGGDGDEEEGTAARLIRMDGGDGRGTRAGLSQ